MFNQQRYITRGIESEIPGWMQAFMWESIGRMEVASKDYLQVFQLDRMISSSNKPVQRIVHTQEQPAYKKEYSMICTPSTVDAKVFVIDDITHSTMLLAKEY